MTRSDILISGMSERIKNHPGIDLELAQKIVDLGRGKETTEIQKYVDGVFVEINFQDLKRLSRANLSFHQFAASIISLQAASGVETENLGKTEIRLYSSLLAPAFLQVRAEGLPRLNLVKEESGELKSSWSIANSQELDLALNTILRSPFIEKFSQQELSALSNTLIGEVCRKVEKGKFGSIFPTEL